MVKKRKLGLIFTAIILICLSLIAPSSVYANSNQSVYLGGFTAGFTLKTRGATIIGITEVISNEGRVSPCKNAGLCEGDVIISMDGKHINCASDISDCLKGYKNGAILVEVLRCGNLKLFNLYPQKDVNGLYKIGVFIREDLQGLGTVSFIDKDGNFASLGHPVVSDNGTMFDVIGGKCYGCSVIGITKGIRGKAGELKGLFLNEKPIGEIVKNTNVGMFGKINDFDATNYKEVEVGTAKIGKAQIVSTVEGQNSEYYDIEIVKTELKRKQGKNLVVKICDKTLIEKTGGIVQGMSGSPILQDGKIVGAITHVFINDSARGYGISIENMLNEM